MRSTIPSSGSNRCGSANRKDPRGSVVVSGLGQDWTSAKAVPLAVAGPVGSRARTRNRLPGPPSGFRRVPVMVVGRDKGTSGLNSSRSLTTRFTVLRTWVTVPRRSASSASIWAGWTSISRPRSSRSRVCTGSRTAPSRGKSSRGTPSPSRGRPVASSKRRLIRSCGSRLAASRTVIGVSRAIAPTCFPDPGRPLCWDRRLFVAHWGGGVICGKPDTSSEEFVDA